MNTINKIICPTDFSSVANNAIEYAANIARELNTEMELLHVKSTGVIDFFNSDDLEENNKIISDKLTKICSEIYQTYTVKSNFSVEVSLKRLEKVICGKSLENNLIVMGTNGTDNLHQYLFGTNTYKVVKNSKCPVLMIPESVTYKKINKIVFAWDYSNDNRISFLQLRDIIKIYNPEIIFLHVSKHKTAISDDMYLVLKDEMFSYFGRKDTITFSRIYLDDADSIAQKINGYMMDSNADLLAVTVYEGGILQRILHGNIVKYLSETAIYPLLALHV